MLSHLHAYSVILLAVSTFARSQPLLHTKSVVPSRIPSTGFVADVGDEKMNEFMLGSTAALATGPRFSYTAAGGHSERRLVTPIIGTASLQTAIGVWCQNSTLATEIYGDISTWDTSSVDDMSHLVESCSTNSNFNDDIGAWDVSSVTDMESMFYRAFSFNQALAAWDVSSVTDMFYMFYDAQAFNQALAAWDVSSVTDMMHMFDSATVFNQALATWDVSSVTDMGGIFWYASAFNQPLATWDVSSVTSMGGMFYYAYAFNQVLCWDMWGVATGNMFYGSGTTYGAAFYNPACPFVPITDSSSLRTAIGVWCQNSTYAADNYGDISTWDTSSVDTTNDLIIYCSSRTTFNENVSAWDVSSVTDMDGMFNGASAFNQALASWDVSSVTDMSEMFWYAYAFDQALAAWDVSRVPNMNLMFYYAQAFNQALAAWDVSSVTDMGGMFDNARAFNQPLAAWDVSSVTDMGGMFGNALAFNQVLCWNMSGVTDTDTGAMFSSSGTTYTAAIDNPVCPLTAQPTLTPSPTPLPSPVSTASPTTSANPSFKPSFNPSSAPSPMPLAPSVLPSSAPSAPSPLPSYSPTFRPTLLPSILPSPLPSSIPTPAPSVTPWFLTSVYFELSAAACGVGVLIAALFAGLFRLRLGRWPPLLRTLAAAVSMASLGIEALYSAAAASSSGQFCTDCPSEAGWTIFMLSGVTCATILVYRLHQLRVALDTSVALGSISIYALVTLLACLEGDLLVWLPWIETPATLALAGFPDDSSISFTTWSILLRKLPFLAFAASNAARSDAISATEYLTLIMTGISLAISLGTKLLRQIAFSNTGLDVFVGVRNDASAAANLTSSEGQVSGKNGGAVRLGDMGDMGEPLLEGGLAGSDEEGGNGISSGVPGNASKYVSTAASQISSAGQLQAVASGTSGYVGVAASKVSSTGWLQTVASAAMGIGLVVLVVTDEVPSFAVVMEISKYLLAVVGAILGLGILALGVRYAYSLMVGGCCNRKAVRMSFLEKLEGDLETAEEKEREWREAAETDRRNQEYISNFVQSEFGVDPEQLLPLEEVRRRLQVIMPRVEAGTASNEEEATMTRLLCLLEANPEAKQQEEEARAAFRAEQAPANATAARRLRSFFPPNARLLPSTNAMETAGVGTSVARRLLRNNALVLVLTPPEEIASMHWVDLRKCSSLGLSLFELRAIVASLPSKFSTDTAKGEKREWAKGIVEALRSMVEKEAKGELQPKDLCHPCFVTCDDVLIESGSLSIGPFNPDLPLTRRPMAVRSEPMSGAAEARAAAALMVTGKSIAERSAAANAALQRRKELPIDRPLAAESVGARRLRERRTSSTGMNKESGEKNLLAEFARAAAARQES